MRIVFLDLDGVVVPFGSYADTDLGLIRSSPHAHLDLLVQKTPAGPAALLRQLADTAEARFVLISSWRKAFPMSFNQAFLRRLGLLDRCHDDWCAPFRFSSHKGHDIGAWLGEHKTVRQRDCLVLDDEELGLRESYGFKRLAHIRPVPNIGFAHGDLACALALWKIVEAVP
mgnify:FL=1